MQKTAAWQDEKLIVRVADWIVRRGLVAPAVFFLEVNKPFGFLGSQVLWGLEPLLGSVMGDGKLAGFARVLEDRTAIEHLIERLESYRDGQDDAAPTQP